ncbi:(2Fe-2S)-binding protein [Marichromatium bheemlicum]|uniref:Bacterioferritin-associated ferredoxin n=1 Tax=Marichromatium bheemlicum TaxID=365339 RepID=A0ABX1IB20_9GAMM|nr:(2Fe-2S)-binding protein [Marichromatium bheemlicum]NKN34433.1 (2Fe-2S)-binding protein [Marichromatium bheemlicum]
MYVCVCNAVTDRQIREAAARGVSSLAQLRQTLAVPGPCGRCARCAHQLLRSTRNTDSATALTPHCPCD